MVYQTHKATSPWPHYIFVHEHLRPKSSNTLIAELVDTFLRQKRSYSSQLTLIRRTLPVRYGDRGQLLQACSIYCDSLPYATNIDEQRCK